MPSPVEINSFDDEKTAEILAMLAEWKRKVYRGSISYDLLEASGSGVFICTVPEGGEALAAFDGTGTPAFLECEVSSLEAGPLPAATVALNALDMPSGDPLTERVYNVLDVEFAPGTRFLAINSRHGYFVAVGGTSGGDSSSSSSSGACPCSCISEGDIEVGGIITASRWSITFRGLTFKVPNGEVTFEAGTYVVQREEGDSNWHLDIGDHLSAKYTSGSSATADAVLEGLLTMTYTPGSKPQVKLCIDGSSIPPEAP
jgi:hypothetical protein